jgi:hypothetical protein
LIIETLERVAKARSKALNSKKTSKRPKNIFNNLLVVSKQADFSVDFTSLEIVQKLANKVIDKKAKEKSV